MKEIFIGSSSEAYPHAVAVAEELKKISGVKPVLWKDVFEAGDITFNRIEELASVISGAVFVISPDDESIVRGQNIKTPRANVIFEYGYLTSRLTRRRVALCKYNDASLPSDFNGLTYIPMGKFVDRSDLDHTSVLNLHTWASNLPEFLPNVSPTLLLHGYSGKWRSEGRFTTWRRLKVNEPDHVIFNSDIVLNIPTSGVGGEGAIYGKLETKIGDCYAEFQIIDRVVDAHVRKDGSLFLRSVMQVRQRLSVRGKIPQKDGFESQMRGTREYIWMLNQYDEEDKSWEGEYTTIIAGSIVSRAKLIFRR